MKCVWLPWRRWFVFLREPQGHRHGNRAASHRVEDHVVKTADSQDADLRPVVVGEEQSGRKEAGQVRGKKGPLDLGRARTHTHIHTQSEGTVAMLPP